MSYWKEQAAKAPPEARTHEYREMLARHLRRYLPDLNDELRAKGDLAAYLTVKTADALEAEKQGVEIGRAHV